MALWLFWTFGIYLFSTTIEPVQGGFCSEAQSYQVQVQHTVSRRCGWFGWSRCTCRYYVWETRTRTINVCCSGYTGSNCAIPICNPTCLNRGVCTDVNQCTCPFGLSGSRCTIASCGYIQDCYPGTCARSGSACVCASGYTGVGGCTGLRNGGRFHHCKLKLSRGAETYERDCVNSDEDLYTNLNFGRLELDWKVSYDEPSDTPVLPNYILYSHPGIVETTANVRILDKDNDTVYEATQRCTGHNVSTVNPFPIVECRNIIHTIPLSNEHEKLILLFSSKTGGFKTVKDLSDNSLHNVTYTGMTYTSEPLTVIYDTERPKHCSERNTNPCDYNDEPALSVNPDNIQGTEAPVYAFGWDDVSFIREYKLKMYRLSYNADQAKLVQTGDSLIDVTYDIANPNAPVVTFDRPGVYSIVMEIYDNAGNMARARTLFVAEQRNYVEVFDPSALRVNDRTAGLAGFWVDSTRPIKINWARLFINRNHMDNKYLVAVKPEITIDFDDRHNGNRTLDVVENAYGIATFDVGWKRQSSSIYTMEGINDLVEEYTFNHVTRTDGEILEFIVTGYDITNYFQNYTFIVRVDTSPPELTGNGVWLEAEENNPIPEDMHYASKIRITAVDRDSGIDLIDFSLKDGASNTEILNNHIQYVSMESNSRRDECTRTGRCYCLTDGGCIDNDIYLWINHCWFARSSNSRIDLLVAYHVANTAGMRTAVRDFQKLSLDVDSLSGINYYPVPENIAISKARGNNLAVVWVNPPSCYTAQHIILRYLEGSTNRETYLAGNATNYTIPDVDADARFRLLFEVVYSNSQRPKTTELSFSASDYIVQPAKLSNGGAVGIAIAVFLFLLLLAALIFMFIRYRQNKHPVPVIIREVKDTARDAISKRFSRHPIAHGTTVEYDNKAINAAKDVYVDVSYPNGDDDMYIYGNMETDPNASWKHSEDRLKIKGNVPGARGRFADIKYGELTLPDGTETVIVKMNKAGASADDKLLMSAKLNYHATQVPTHPYLVNLVGGVPSPQRPILLLEYCNAGTLQAWLQKIHKVTGDVEEQMVIFTMEIAEGMDFLHDKGLVHRRLGVRNVLLHRGPDNDQLVARLTGFGPLKGETDDHSGEKSDRVPIKYMAPEQLYKPIGKKRIYNTKTDVWTYGIAVWEIFSIAQKPYSSSTISETKRFILDGGRMSRPTECPKFMYESIILPCWEADPTDRPGFALLVAKLRREYGRQSGAIYEYDEGDKPSYAMQVD